MPAQAVQNSSFDLMLGVGSQLDLARRLETVDGRDEAQDTGGHQIVQAHVPGQAVVNLAGDQAYLGQMLEDQTFALFGAIVLG